MQRAGTQAGRALVAVVALAMVVTAACGGASTGARRSGSTTAADAVGSASTTAVTPSSTTSAPAAPASAPPPSTAPAVVPPAISGGLRTAVVTVAVATVWRSPSAPRPVDGAAVGAPVDIRRWLAAMTVADMRGLDGRADTQVLLGDTVLVMATAGEWAHVVVPDQSTPLDGRGYPGWVPLRQLTFAPAARPAPATGPDAAAGRAHPAADASVVAPTTWLSNPVTGERLMEVSFATRLPSIGTDGATVTVVLPDGRPAGVAARDVVLSAPGAPAVAATSQSVADAARRFVGVPYLWAGTSGFALDCSGLAHLDYRLHGLTIPRDADAQASAGIAVGEPGRATQPGDLVFFARGGHVHHVGVLVSPTAMVQAPSAGEVVEVVSPGTPGRRAELAGARRFLS